jgi:hypothetical protein
VERVKGIELSSSAWKADQFVDEAGRYCKLSRHIINAQCSNNANLDPLGTNTASSIQSNVSSGFAALRATLPITMASGTHYTLNGFASSITPPVWLEVFIGDSSTGTNFVQFWVNTSTGAVGTTSATAGGVVDSITAVGSAPNSFWQYQVVFHFTSTPAADNFIDMRFVDSDGGGTPTNSQAFFMWGWGA